MRLAESFAPLRDRSFRLFFLGRAVSMLGSSMAPVALAFGVLDLVDSAAALGIVLAARSVPMAGFMLLGGVVADRFPRSTVLRLSHLGAALTQGAVAVLLITGHAEVWMIVVLEFANGTVVAFTFPALQGVLPQLVPRHQLQQANAMMAFTRNVTLIVGPGIAGALVVTVGSGWAIGVDALTYGFAAACMGLLSVPAYARDGSAGMWHDLREGWGEFRSREWVWVVVAAFGVMNMIHAGLWYTLGPAIARDTIGERGWGLVLGAEAAGFFLASIVLLRVSIRYPLRAGMLGMLVGVLPFLALGVAPQVVLLIGLSMAAGAGMEVFSVGWATALQQHVPEEVLGRVFSYDALGSFVAIPVGQLLAGPLAAVFGTTEVVVAATVLYALVASSTLLSRSVRGLERAPAEQVVGS
ncbi:MAG: MFS transporter [Actinomycetota bacterium]|nr:MFS transporter [Actinomycetota bacterium]